ncbi:PREDICTED: uncharacterized protein LOC104773757 [Camelina sativa]|uniref:Uncharacterized protein LOC104773757 n=1 Tax=Camelina sativa TaxID=90675 RepID=A0ABM0Y7E0_CAMSA|nr:PREDICTED: uncharacterized protein LOC104773757 [Camelina sativa]
MRKQVYQPLLDKIHAKFSSWSVIHLSFARRLQLIQSVIYYTIAFWASICILPKSCLEEIESLCSAFLCKGAPNSARGATASWESVCTPKENGGLGLKRVVHWNKVFVLKPIWEIFAAGGSLWVSCVWRNLIGRPLLDITGDARPIVSGLTLNSVVVDAIRDGQWWIAHSRTPNTIVQLLKACLPSASVINLQEIAQDDCYLWKIGDAPTSNKFSTAATWTHLHPLGSKVDWFEAVGSRVGSPNTLSLLGSTLVTSFSPVIVW